MPHTLTFDGLRPEPLACYCAALGVHRLVAEQVDQQAKGWWCNDRYHLQSRLDRDGLIKFFIHQYHPTPMASPWNASGGFFGRSSDSAVTQIESSDDPRFAGYRAVLAIINDTLRAHNMDDRPATPAHKLALLQSLHSNLTPDAGRWLDAVFHLRDDSVTYHALFITGGNSARFDFARRFMEHLTKLLIEPGPDSESLLQSALFGTLTGHLQQAAAGPHNPGSSGGINASSEELEAEPLSNPWTYVLGMEGALLCGGHGQAAHRPTGYPSAAPEETRFQDLWLPLWSSPLTLVQLQQQLALDPDHHTLRYSLLPRNGRSYFAVPVSRRRQPLDSRPAFIKNLEQQLEKPRTRDLDEALLEEPPNPTRILEVLGALHWEEAELPKLPKEWIAAADDGTAEFGCALALSGLSRGLKERNLNLHPQLEHFVGQDLYARMLGFLRGRARWSNQVSKRPTSGGYPRFNAPFWSTHRTRPGHIEAFLAGRTDEARLERLFRALRLVEPATVDTAPEPAFLPYPFAIAKLAFHQHQDRRPVPVEIAEALAENQPNVAIALAARFLDGRHPGFPQDWPACPPVDPRTARRWAAALLFPISDASYEAILGDLCAQ